MSLYRFVAAQKTEFPVTLLCQVVGVSRSGFYAWQQHAGGLTAREVQDVELTVLIQAAYVKGRSNFGAPRVLDQLRRAGVHTSRKRVARLMAKADLVGRCGRRRVRTTVVDPGAAPAPDLVERNFQPPAPDQVWYGDIERHEALLDHVVMKGHHRAFVVADVLKLRAA